jgi:hypothetical protein
MADVDHDCAGNHHKLTSRAADRAGRFKVTKVTPFEILDPRRAEGKTSQRDFVR